MPRMVLEAPSVLVVSEDAQLRVAFANVLDLYDVRTTEPALALPVLREAAYAAIVYDVGALRSRALAFVNALTDEERERLLVIDAVHHSDALARRAAGRRVTKPISASELRAVVARLTRTPSPSRPPER